MFLTPIKLFHSHKLDTSEAIKFLKYTMSINVWFDTLGQIVYSPIRAESTF